MITAKIYFGALMILWVYWLYWLFMLAPRGKGQNPGVAPQSMIYWLSTRKTIVRMSEVMGRDVD